LLVAAAIEPDDIRRREIWWKFQEIIHEDVGASIWSRRLA
jgi:hypothetical protein